MTPEELGRKGGEQTRARHGSAHFAAIGRKGGLSRHNSREKGMSLFLVIPPATYAVLQNEAKRQGLRVQQIVRAVLDGWASCLSEPYPVPSQEEVSSGGEETAPQIESDPHG